jgi:hypothetical protein
MLCIGVLPIAGGEASAHLAHPGGPARKSKPVISLALSARLRCDRLVGRGVAELPKELESVCRSRILDWTLGDDFEVAVSVAADDGNLNDEAFVHQDGELAVGEGELAGHGGGGELGEAGEVAALDGGEVLLHHLVLAERSQASREAAALRFDGALDVTGAGAAVRTDGRLARWEGLGESGRGVLAGLHRGGAALGALFRGQRLALGPAALSLVLSL